MRPALVWLCLFTLGGGCDEPERMPYDLLPYDRHVPTDFPPPPKDMVWGNFTCWEIVGLRSLCANITDDTQKEADCIAWVLSRANPNGLALAAARDSCLDNVCTANDGGLGRCPDPWDMGTPSDCDRCKQNAEWGRSPYSDLKNAYCTPFNDSACGRCVDTFIT